MKKLKDIIFSSKKREEDIKPVDELENKEEHDNNKSEVRRSKYAPCCTVSYHLAVSNNHPLINANKEE